MIRLIQLVFLFVAFICCAVPLAVGPDPSPPPLAAFETAVRAKFAPVAAPSGFRVAAAFVEQAEATLSDSELSCRIVGHYGAAQTRDRSWIVHAGPNTRVVGYSSSAGPAGAVLNLRGSNSDGLLNRQLTLPRPVVAGDALIVVSGAPAGSFSSIDEAMAVVFVNYPVNSSLLRPPAIGNSELTRWFRTLGPIPEDFADFRRCPSVIDLSRIYAPGGPINPNAWGAAPPSLAELRASLRRFSGDVIDGWPAAYHSPSKQHKGYGTFFAGEVSTALLLCCSTLGTFEERRDLALALVQRGIDQIGALADGRVLYPNGGHCQGRKALVIFAGHLMDMEPFYNPTPYVGNVFQEDDCYKPGTWWFGSDWTVTWGFRKEAPYDGRLFANPPSTWGDRNAPNHDSWNWLAGYMSQVVPCQVGTATVMTLLGREKEMGGLVQMVRQFMKGPPPAADAAMRAVGQDVPWGTDYAGPTGFASTAWKLWAR